MRPNYIHVLFALHASIFFCQIVLSQENPLAQFRWQKRCILLITDFEQSKKYHQQINAFGELDSEFESRKICVIEVRRSKYRIKYPTDLNGIERNWIMNGDLFSRYALKNKNYTIALIGLDGGMKLRQADIVSRRELFDRIDAMPMRRVELKNKY